MNKLIIIFMIFSQSIFGYEVEIHNLKHDPENVVIEVVDDCKYSHKLLISKKKLSSGYAIEWLQMLFESGEYNKFCKND